MGDSQLRNVVVVTAIASGLFGVLSMVMLMGATGWKLDLAGGPAALLASIAPRPADELSVKITLMTGEHIRDSNSTSWKKAWGKLTAKAGLPGLRFHDLRHHAITELLTNPSISVQPTKSIAGHVSQRMVDRYAHIRLEAKRSALEALSGKGNGTNNGTKSGPQQPPPSQVVDSIGRRVGI